MIIKMRTNCDCMVAVLAMLLNCSYEEAGEYFPPKAIKHTGYRWEWLIPYLSKCGVHLTWFEQRTIHLVDWTKPAMVDVPSLTTDIGDHIIYWDGEKVIDPSNTVKYKKLPKIIYNVYQYKIS